MIGLLSFVLAVLASPLKSKARLEAENAVLRHQLIVLRRGRMAAPGSPTMIVCSLSSCIAGLHQFCRLSQSSGPRRCCGGIGPGFAVIGVGNRIDGEGGHQSRRRCWR